MAAVTDCEGQDGLVLLPPLALGGRVVVARDVHVGRRVHPREEPVEHPLLVADVVGGAGANEAILLVCVSDSQSKDEERETTLMTVWRFSW